MMTENNKETYRPYRNLWIEVICRTVREARARVVRARDLEAAVRDELNYFRSRDFSLICELGFVKFELTAIEKFLRGKKER